MSASTTFPFRITAAQNIAPLNTAQLIHAAANIDTRSAVDQFLEVFDTLNVLVSRRGVGQPASEAAGEAINGEPGHNDAQIAGEDALDLDSLDAFGSEDEEGDTGEEPAHGEPLEATHADLATVGATEDAVVNSEIVVIPEPVPDEAPPGTSQSFVPSEDELNYQLNNLVFLGYVSAVESYLRCLTRQLVMVDEYTADAVADQKITYGAAKHSTKELLPDAFLEDMTFISKSAIDGLLRDIYKISPQKLEKHLAEYQKICQLRHCIVHRFGKLGTNNAIKLGLRTHAALFGKPIRLSASDLGNIAYTLINLVKAINDHVYVEVLRRSAKQSTGWQWDFQQDEESFRAMYDIFISMRDPASRPTCEQAYDAFKAMCETGSATATLRQRSRPPASASST